MGIVTDGGGSAMFGIDAKSAVEPFIVDEEPAGMEPDSATVDGIVAEAGDSGAIVALTGAAMDAGMGLKGGVAATDAVGAAEVVLGLLERVLERTETFAFRTGHLGFGVERTNRKTSVKNSAARTVTRESKRRVRNPKLAVRLATKLLCRGNVAR
jgi:hypothetical protein